VLLEVVSFQSGAVEVSVWDVAPSHWVTGAPDFKAVFWFHI